MFSTTPDIGLHRYVETRRFVNMGCEWDSPMFSGPLDTYAQSTGTTTTTTLLNS